MKVYNIQILKEFPLQWNYSYWNPGFPEQISSRLAIRHEIPTPELFTAFGDKENNIR